MQMSQHKHVVICINKQTSKQNHKVLSSEYRSRTKKYCNKGSALIKHKLQILELHIQDEKG